MCVLYIKPLESTPKARFSLKQRYLSETASGFIYKQTKLISNFQTTETMPASGTPGATIPDHFSIADLRQQIMSNVNGFWKAHSKDSVLDKGDIVIQSWPYDPSGDAYRAWFLVQSRTERILKEHMSGPVSTK